MVSSTVLYVFCALAVKLSSSGSTSHWSGRIKLERQMTVKKDGINIDDDFNFFEEVESHTIQTSEDVTFWVPNENITETSLPATYNEGESDEKNSTAFEDLTEDSKVDFNDTVNVEPIAADKEDVGDKYIEHDDMNNIPKMDRNILLARNNCNLEIEVSQVEDVRVRIKIEPLKQNSSGKCCITLNGYEGTMLAVLLSDIHLSHHLNNRTQGETLKVVVTTAGVDFVIKEYCGEDKNLPLLLTETNRVYLMIYYNVTTITPGEGYTEFNLEAFTYHKNENSVMNKEDYENHYSTPNSNIQNVYFTTRIG